MLAAAVLLRLKDLDGLLPVRADLAKQPNNFVLRGGSAIIGPDGQYLTEPFFDQEMIITPELDLDAINKEQMKLDVSGHYSRPDLFDFRLKAHA